MANPFASLVKPKGESNESATNKAPSLDSIARATGNTGGVAASSGASSDAEQLLASPNAKEDRAEATRTNPFAKSATTNGPAGSGSIPLGGEHDSPVSGSGRPKLAGFSNAARPDNRSASIANDAGAVDSLVSGLGGIDDFAASLGDISNIAEVRGESKATNGLSQFDDETPADKPTRELPADADDNLIQFVAQLDMVYELHHDPELMGNVIRGIMIELGDNPQYDDQISDSDMRTMLQGMRRSMGLAVVKKSEAKAKRGGATKGKGTGRNVDMSLLAGFEGVNFD